VYDRSVEFEEPSPYFREQNLPAQNASCEDFRTLKADLPLKIWVLLIAPFGTGGGTNYKKVCSYRPFFICIYSLLFLIFSENIQTFHTNRIILCRVNGRSQEFDFFTRRFRA
jgi:hypothetical protein